MPQLISSLILGVSFVLEEHAANELEWLHSEDRIVNRHDLGTSSDSNKSDTCSANRRPNPAPMDRARLIAQSSWYQRCLIRSVLAAMIIVAAGSFIEPARADPRWCAISNQATLNCSFTTIKQCHAEVSGIGGFCMWEAPVGHRQPTRASIEAAPKGTP